MTKEQQDKIVDKIKRLLALGDRTKNHSEAEAEAAILKAQELMAKHNISMSETDDEIVYEHQEALSKWNMSFRKPLSQIIASNFRCECYINGASKGMVFFGRQNDARIAKEVFEYAYAFAMKRSTAAYNRNYNAGLVTKGVVNSYINGFLIGLKTRLDEQCTALLIVTPPDVKEAFQDLTKDFRQDKNRMRNTRMDFEAYEEGMHDGKTVLNGRRIENGRN